MNIRKILVLLLAACIILPGFVLAANTGYRDTGSYVGSNTGHSGVTNPGTTAPGVKYPPVTRNSTVTTGSDTNAGSIDMNNASCGNNRHVTGPPTTKPTTKIPTFNIGTTISPDYDARIAALEKQVAEQNKELKRQGTMLDQILNFLKIVLGLD